MLFFGGELLPVLSLFILSLFSQKRPLGWAVAHFISFGVFVAVYLSLQSLIDHNPCAMSDLAQTQLQPPIGWMNETELKDTVP